MYIALMWELALRRFRHYLHGVDADGRNDD
jgi:hypothetical protein